LTKRKEKCQAIFWNKQSSVISGQDDKVFSEQLDKLHRLSGYNHKKQATKFVDAILKRKLMSYAVISKQTLKIIRLLVVLWRFRNRLVLSTLLDY